eukprot:6196700-Pleurochrysis_carterae.AAC.1
MVRLVSWPAKSCGAWDALVRKRLRRTHGPYTVPRHEFGHGYTIVQMEDVIKVVVGTCLEQSCMNTSR